MKTTIKRLIRNVRLVTYVLCGTPPLAFDLWLASYNYAGLPQFCKDFLMYATFFLGAAMTAVAIAKIGKGFIFNRPKRAWRCLRYFTASSAVCWLVFLALLRLGKIIH